jgi:hypothetical protein
MKNLKESQKANLNEFLSKCSSLDKLLDTTYRLSQETRENIEWYCDYRIHQYYERYCNYLLEQKRFEKKQSAIDK